MDIITRLRWETEMYFIFISIKRRESRDTMRRKNVGLDLEILIMKSTKNFL